MSITTDTAADTFDMNDLASVLCTLHGAAADDDDKSPKGAELRNYINGGCSLVRLVHQGAQPLDAATERIQRRFLTARDEARTAARGMHAAANDILRLFDSISSGDRPEQRDLLIQMITRFAVQSNNKAEQCAKMSAAASMARLLPSRPCSSLHQ